MGHLFSRALKRITQGAQPARSNQQIHNQSPAEQQDTTNDTSQYASDRVQSIPVGQSIDSAEYAGLRHGPSTAAAIKEPQVEPQDVPEPERKVEEAAIKIQALVRGHLTRKALKDAQSQSVPPPTRNSLGQRQFAEECLLGNNDNNNAAASASPIFLNLGMPTVATSVTEDTSSRDNRLTTGREEAAPARQGAPLKSNTSNAPAATLNSIAEHPELGERPQLVAEAEAELQTQASSDPTRCGEKKKLPLKLCARASTYPPQLLDTPEPSDTTRDHSLSPVPSEANVSIDLNYDTPASASIEIGDHNIRPADKLASVLHHKVAGPQQAASGAAVLLGPAVGEEKEEAPAAERDSLDSANKLSEVQEEEQEPPLPEQSTAPISPATIVATASTATATVVEQTVHHLANGNREPSFTENSNSNYTNTNNHEEAAAIRIQSAFRGYRTRKNSPYRTRSPPSSSPNKLQQAGEQLLNGTSGGAPLVQTSDSLENRLLGEEESLFLITGADISGETSVSNLGERRSSRPRARDSLDRQNTNTSDQHATPTTTDGPQEVAQVCVVGGHDNVAALQEEDCVQSKQDHWSQGKAAELLPVEESQPQQQQQKKDPMMRVETFDRAPTSNNEELTNELTEPNESELGTETVAALLGMTTIESLAGLKEKRASVKSDASVETIGSSFAAALLSSMEDEASLAFVAANNSTSEAARQEALDEDKSLGAGGGCTVSLTVDELDLEGLRLEGSAADIGEPRLIDGGGALVEDSVVSTDDQPAVDQRPDNQEEEEEGEFVQASEQEEDEEDSELDIKTPEKELKRVPTLDEQEQLTIELESDDIERRDPRGQTTTERTTKSPSIPHQAGLGKELGALVAADEEKDAEDATCKTTSYAQLETAALEQQQTTPAEESPTSLESSPTSGHRLEANLTDSSGSSGDDEADDEPENAATANQKQQHHPQQQQQQQPPTSGGTTSPTSKNKRRHRNKRKSGKK